MFILYTLIALAAGVALASQAAINSQLAKAMGNEPLIATFISFGTGALLLLVITTIKTDLVTHLSTVTQHSWWKFIGGTLGVIVVFTTILLSPKMGITNMLFFYYCWAISYSNAYRPLWIDSYACARSKCVQIDWTGDCRGRTCDFLFW